MEAARAEFEALAGKLESEEFKERKAAKEEILVRGPEILPLIEEAIKKSESPESKVALKQILQTLSLQGSQAASTPEEFASAVLESRMDHIRRIVSHGQRDFRVTSSSAKMNGLSFLGSANDGAFPRRSDSGLLPAFNWGPAKGTVEWLQYDFPEARTISSAEVFWHLGNNHPAPVWWEVLYKNGEGAWVPVKAEGRQEECKPNVFQGLQFPAVKTDAVRLSVQLPASAGTGVFEFRVGEKAGEE